MQVLLPCLRLMSCISPASSLLPGAKSVLFPCFMCTASNLLLGLIWVLLLGQSLNVAKYGLSSQMVLLILTEILATLVPITVTPMQYVVQELAVVSSANVRLASVEMEMFAMVSENSYYKMTANVAFCLLGMYWPSGLAIPAKWGWFGER